MTQRQTLTFGDITWYYSLAPNAWSSTSVGGTYTGKLGADNAMYGSGNDTLIGGGGGGDNIFYLAAGDKAVAGVGDGIDTITSYWGSVTLPAGFADGILSSPGTITGNSGNNILTVTGTGAHTLHAGSGNDVLIGASGATDRFVITKGSSVDVIMGFQPSKDVVELDNFPAFSGAGGFAALRADMTQSGANVVLNLGGTQTLTFAGTTISQLTASDFALPINLTGWKETFDDEFNTFSASATSHTTTWHIASGTRAANHEAENYSTNLGAGSPFNLSNGVLDITATPTSSAPGLPYTSGDITSQYSFAQTYGFFEISAQLPAGQGMWPAFWLLPANGSWPPELDVMEELGQDPTTLYTTTHSQVAATNSVGTTVSNMSTGFNTYGVDWEPNTITYYFNGNAIATVPTPADMNQPMYMVINLGVGGVGSWPGAATGETGSMLVDWVRVYASPTAVQPPLTLTGWGMAITEGAGNFSITGNGYGGWITLGNGNQSILLTGTAGTMQGSENTIITGNGNQTITTVGVGNIITTGNGTSAIDAGSSYSKVTVGATASGTTTIKVTGIQDVISSTGAGNVNVSGPQGDTTINLQNGNDTINLTGIDNTVTIGNGTSVVNAGNGAEIVHTGTGSSTITVTGYGNLLDAGSGMNFLHGGSGNDTFVLNGPQQGVDTITGFTTTNHDVLDLTRTLVGLVATANMSNIADFVFSEILGANTALMVGSTAAGGALQTVAMLDGVDTNFAILLAHDDVRVGSALY